MTDKSLVKSLKTIDFWSEVDDLITLTTATTNVAVPAVAVSMPSIRTMLRVVQMLKIREIEDDSAAGNAINGAFNIKTMLTGGSWGTDDVVAINIKDNMFVCGASKRTHGDVIIGDNNISSVVSKTGGYLSRMDGNAFVDGNSLYLRDVQSGLRVYYY